MLDLRSSALPAVPAALRPGIAAQVARAPALARRLAGQPTPCYLFDRAALDAAIGAFLTAFDAHVPRHRAFYAIKSNPHPLVLRAAVARGLGLDASSPEEVTLALAAGARALVFSGPGKTTAQITDVAARCSGLPDFVINADSEGELHRIDAAGRALGRPIRAGLRVFAAQHEEWSKFGEPLTELPRLWRLALALPGVAIAGLQSHRSYNNDAARYLAFLQALRAPLQALSAAERAQIKLLDLGGGYKPAGLECAYADDVLPYLAARAEPTGADASAALPPLAEPAVAPLADFARQIGAGAAALVEDGLLPADCTFVTEPGRVLAAPSMHFLFSVVDRKRGGLCIVDGGINMVGWERYLHVFSPLINLSRPALQQTPVRICGSLCDPEDVWGFSCFGAAPQEGDLLLMPNQGAYTVGMAQSFIRAIPPVVELDDRENLTAKG